MEVSEKQGVLVVVFIIGLISTIRFWFWYCNIYNTVSNGEGAGLAILGLILTFVGTWAIPYFLKELLS